MAGRAHDPRGAGPRRPPPAHRQRALCAAPVPGRTRAGRGAPPRAHRLRRPLPQPADGDLRRDHPRGSAQPPHLEHGPQDHHRLGHPDEQGARGHRGALAVRRGSRADRGARASRSRSCTPSSSSWTGRCWPSSASPTCACPSSTRSATPNAGPPRFPASTSRGRCASTSTLPTARRSPVWASPTRPWRPAAPRPPSSTRPTRRRCPPSWTAASPSRPSRTASARSCARSRPGPSQRLEDVLQADRAALACAPGTRFSRRPAALAH